MVCMHMADKYGVDFFPFEIQHLQRNLGSLSAVKQKELPVPANHRTGKIPIGKRHHAAGPQNKYFKIHAVSIAENRS